MDSQSAFVLGALVATVKGIGLVAIGAAVAWWRARRRVRELEIQLAQAALTDAPAVARLESGIEYLTAQIEEIARHQRDDAPRLPRPLE